MQPSQTRVHRHARSIAGLPWDGFDAYLFDIDGTLLNCRDAVHYDSFHCALRQVWNCQRKIDGLPLHGNTDIGILRAASAGEVSPDEFSGGLPRALAIMRQEVERNAACMRPELCPSISIVLARLHRAGKLLGVASGAIEPVGWAKLRAAGLAHYFSFGSFSADAAAVSGAELRAIDRQGSQPHELSSAGRYNESRAGIFRHGISQVRSRLGENARICFVGDTPSDIAAAKSLRTPILAVATGIYSIDTLQEHEPDLCLPCCDWLFGGELR
jgi:phosphoglycolate phosphatase-like HAD superfamily hydrolase